MLGFTDVVLAANEVPTGIDWGGVAQWILIALVKYALPYMGAASLVVIGFLVRFALIHEKAGKLRHFTLLIATCAQKGVAFVEQTMIKNLRDPITGALPPNLDRALLFRTAIEASLNYGKSQMIGDFAKLARMSDEDLGKAIGVEIQNQILVGQDAHRPAGVDVHEAVTEQTEKVTVKLASGRVLVMPKALIPIPVPEVPVELRSEPAL